MGSRNRDSIKTALITCPTCRGEGLIKIPGTEDMICGTCNGTGMIKQSSSRRFYRRPLFISAVIGVVILAIIFVTLPHNDDKTTPPQATINTTKKPPTATAVAIKHGTPSPVSTTTTTTPTTPIPGQPTPIATSTTGQGTPTVTPLPSPSILIKLDDGTKVRDGESLTLQPADCTGKKSITGIHLSNNGTATLYWYTVSATYQLTPSSGELSVSTPQRIDFDNVYADSSVTFFGGNSPGSTSQRIDLIVDCPPYGS